jgi:hypothetical protein
MFCTEPTVIEQFVDLKKRSKLGFESLKLVLIAKVVMNDQAEQAVSQVAVPTTSIS